MYKEDFALNKVWYAIKHNQPASQPAITHVYAVHNIFQV